MVQGNGKRQVELKVDGMSCGHCVAAVKQALQGVPGATVDEVRVGFARVTVFDRAGATMTETVESQLTDAVDDAGFTAHVVGQAGQ